MKEKKEYSDLESFFRSECARWGELIEKKLIEIKDKEMTVFDRFDLIKFIQNLMCTSRLEGLMSGHLRELEGEDDRFDPDPEVKNYGKDA